jgi:hypothetical protein
LGRRLPTVLGVRAAVDQKVARRWLVGGVVWPRCARPHQLSRGGVMLLRLPKGWRDGGPWLRGRRNAPQASTADRPPRRQGLFSLCAVAAFPNSRSSESCIELKRDVFVRFLANCGSLLGRCSPPPWRHPSFLSPLSGPLLQIRAAARGPKIFPDSLDRWLIVQKIRVFFRKWTDAYPILVVRVLIRRPVVGGDVGTLLGLGISHRSLCKDRKPGIAQVQA